MGEFDDLVPAQSSSTVKSSGGGTFDDLIPQAPPTKTLAEKVLSGVVKNIALPVNNPLETAGKKIKGEVQSVLSNAATAPSNINPELKAGALTAASALTDAAPFTPSEFSTMAAGEVAPAAVSEALKGPALSIANRFANAPADIAKSRYVKGKPSVGQEMLNQADKGGIEDWFGNAKPEGMPVTQDKNVIYQWAENKKNQLGKLIGDKINEVFQEGKRPNVPYGPQNKPLALEYNPGTTQQINPSGLKPSGPAYPGFEATDIPGQFQETGLRTAPNPTDEGLNQGLFTPSEPAKPGGMKGFSNSVRSLKSPQYGFSGANPKGVSTKEIADSMNPIIEEAKDNFGDTSPQAQRLIAFKNDWLSGKPEYLNFRAANALREALGSSIGKRGFNNVSGELPEMLEAQKAIWSTLRQKIGQISPEVDQLLNEQHNLMDIQRSVLPGAAKGFSNLPHTLTEAAISPAASNMSLANTIYNTIPANRGTGLTGLIANYFQKHPDQIPTRTK